MRVVGEEGMEAGAAQAVLWEERELLEASDRLRKGMRVDVRKAQPTSDRQHSAQAH